MSCRHPDLTKALNHCYKSELCEIPRIQRLVTQCKVESGADDSTFASNLGLISELVQKSGKTEAGGSVCLMLGIDTDLQISLQTRDVMYAAEKGAPSLLESSEPAGRVRTKPRRSSMKKPEPLLPLEPLDSWDKMRRKNITKRKKILNYYRLYEAKNIYKGVDLQ